MSAAEVQRLLRQAVAHSDAEAMREAFERLLGGRGDPLSPEAEHEIRHPEYVMEMPQSGERIRGRDSMRAMQEAFDNPPTITLRRVVGTGRTWVVEGVNEYPDGDAWNVVVVLELDTDGRIVRDTRYYAKPFEAPEWRAGWVERM